MQKDSPLSLQSSLNFAAQPLVAPLLQGLCLLAMLGLCLRSYIRKQAQGLQISDPHAEGVRPPKREKSNGAGLAADGGGFWQGWT